ncbi:MAG: hypothetical protein M1822_002807 [Bathelium mastoideum]|nr:MAG: hypothetical protein M1822_002807 [Bathelium mastoideum]
MSRGIEERKEGLQYLESVVRACENLISDDIISRYPVQNNSFQKLRSLVKLVEHKEARVGEFVRPTDDGFKEANVRARQFNEFVERLLPEKDLPSDYKHQVDSNLRLTRAFELAGHCKQRKKRLKIDFISCDDENSAQFTKLEYCAPNFLPDVPDKSLASVIDEHGLREGLEGGIFTPRDKADLLLRLAISLLQLPRESWMSNKWCAEQLHFIVPQNPSEGLDLAVNHLYLSASLGFTVLLNPEPGGLSPSNTYILSFALLMLEILIGKRIVIDSDLWSAVEEALLDDKVQMYPTKHFVKAIEACLNFEIQTPFLPGNSFEEQMRIYVFQSIVKPLQDYCSQWSRPKDERQKHRHGRKFRYSTYRSPKSQPSTRTADPQAPPGQLASHAAEDDGGDASSETDGTGSDVSYTDANAKSRVKFQDNVDEIESDSTIEDEGLRGLPAVELFDELDFPLGGSKNWTDLAGKFFQDIALFNNRFVRTKGDGVDKIPLPEWQQRPIRIVILDSGVKIEGDPFLSAAKRRIVGMKSWTGDNCEDSHGHGTHVARILLRSAPYAELCIAKISETKTIPVSQLPAIGEAIKWAVGTWDVDIISMSLGLDEVDATIEEALNLALKPDKANNRAEKIIFAAAANGGPSRARAWPACKPGIICINASDGHGGDINQLSPAASAEDYNFVTLGLSIASRWQRKEVLKSGTSFATPMAAAIAANLLEYIRVNMRIERADKDWLYSSKGMRRLLKRFSVQIGGYRFLTPWKAPEGRRLSHEYLKSQIKRVCSRDYFK